MSRIKATLAALAAAIIITVTGCTPSEASTTTTTAAITYSYWGDSLTALPGSWWYQIQPNKTLKSLGGYGHPGWTSAQMVDRAKSYPADVTVVELGTNDALHGISNAETEANISKIVAKAGGKHVLVVAIPPSDLVQTNFTLNKALSGWVASKGWLYADPFSFLRQINDTYMPGTTLDGVHPTTEQNKTVGSLMAVYIKQAAQGAGR